MIELVRLTDYPDLPSVPFTKTGPSFTLGSWLREQREASAPQYIGGPLQVDCRTSECPIRGPFTIGFKEVRDPLPDVLPCPGCGKPWTVLATSRD